jgi:HEAT repeat protein
MATSPDEDTFVRGHAAAAIGAIGDPAGADVLINLLLDEEPMVRVKAAQGLATIGRESAIQPLIKGMELAESSNEAEIIAASIDKIARTLNYPCDLEALGTDFKNWLSWYDAVKAEE